jgi:hypothetical protein
VLICLEPSWPALSVALNEDIPSSEVSGHNNSIVNSLTGPNDRRPPDIELMGISDNQTVYTEKIYIAGHVIDENTIKALTLNKSSILNSPARKIFFSHLVEIKEGSNRITIEAVDKAGNRAREDITVVRRKGQHLQLPAEVAARRLRVALYPFEKSGAVSAESVPFLDLLTLDLQTQNRFQLVDRSYMDRILEEQNFSLSKLIDRNAAVKLGKLMSAQAIITGNIVETPDGTEVVGRMIDTETSEILAMEKIYSYQKGIAALSFLAESLSVKFHNDFPMLSGIIIKHKDGHLYTDLGKGKISPHGRLIVYRSNKSDKGASSLKVTIMGYARVTEILPDMSKAEFFSGNPDEIRVMDKVAVQ